MRRFYFPILSSLIVCLLLAPLNRAQNPTFRAQNVTTGAPPPSGTPFILTQTLGSLRNDFTGCLGFLFTTVSGTGPTVTALGRWVVAGNSGTHTIYLYDASYTIIASASINTSGATAGAYKYVAITPVVLAASTTHTICSAETNLGDQWLGDNTAITSVTSGIATVVEAEGNTAVPPTSPNNFGGASGSFSFGPVNFLTP